jgi:hypothetical protein
VSAGSKSRFQLEGLVRVSERPAMVLPSPLNVPVKRCEKVERREVGRLSHQRPAALAEVIAFG